MPLRQVVFQDKFTNSKEFVQKNKEQRGLTDEAILAGKKKTCLEHDSLTAEAWLQQRAQMAETMVMSRGATISSFEGKTMDVGLCLKIPPTIAPCKHKHVCRSGELGGWSVCVCVCVTATL